MRDVVGDLWGYPADARCITTNGTVKRNGEAVLGRGCAAEAARRYPGLAQEIGTWLVTYGNQVMVSEVVARTDRSWLVTFPVKHHWREKADLKLIEQSAWMLVEVANLDKAWKTIVIPRPGCGNGGLSWADVRSKLVHILDDRFHVITHP